MAENTLRDGVCMTLRGDLDDDAPTSLSRAYQQVAMRLSTMRPDEVLPTPVDPRHAALTALLVSDLIARPEVLARFQSLESTGEFDSRVVYELPTLARAVLFATSQAAAECVLPVAAHVCDPGLEVRDRMMLACASRLDRIPEAVRRFDGLRGGSSPADVVRDLRILADLYRDFGPFIGVEQVRLDQALARTLADRIEDASAVGGSAERAAWREKLRRAWSLLVPTYEEVRRAGRFLFRTNDDDGRFPELPLAPRVERASGSLVPPPMARHAVHRATVPVDTASLPVARIGGDSLAHLVAATRDASVTGTTPFDSNVPPESAPYDTGKDALSPHEAAALDALQRAIDSADSGPPLRVVHGHAEPDGTETEESALSGSVGLILEEVTISEEDEDSSADACRRQDPGDTGLFPRTSTVLRVLDGPSQHQREYDRYRVELSVTLVSRSNFYIGVTDNLSEGGLFIATQEFQPRGTPVELMVVLPGQDAPLAIGGEVRWVREYAESSAEPPGLGIRFIDLSDRATRAIRAFLVERPPLLYDE